MRSQKWSFCIPAFITLNFKRNDPSIIHAIFQNTSIFESVTCWKTPESTLVNFEHRMGSKATLSYILITLILCLLHYRHLMCAELHHSQSRIDHSIDIKSYWLLILSNIEIPEHKKTMIWMYTTVTPQIKGGHRVIYRIKPWPQGGITWYHPMVWDNLILLCIQGLNMKSS